MLKAKHFILTAVLMLICNGASAQFELGFKGGFAAGWIPGTQLIGYEKVMPHNGFYVGAIADYLFDNITLQAELTYAAKGHSDRSQQDGKYSRDLRYLQLPLYLGYRINPRLTVLAGPELGLLLTAKVTQDEIKWDGKADCHPFNVAIAAQFNYMVSDHFGVDIKGYYGLNRTFCVPYMIGNTPYEDKGHNAGFQIGFCYKFQLD